MRVFHNSNFEHSVVVEFFRLMTILTFAFLPVWAYAYLRF